MSTLSCKLAVILIGVSTLMGCAAVHTTTNIQPSITLDNSYTFSNQQPWKISSQDQRIERHLIEIVDGDDIAELVNEKNSLRSVIEQNLTTAWLNNKLKMDTTSDYQLDIKLVKSLATVTKTTFGYDVSSQMKVKIILSHQGASFSKLFIENKQWDKGFYVSTEDITRHLNSQLSALLTRIIEDQALNKELQGFQ